MQYKSISTISQSKPQTLLALALLQKSPALLQLEQLHILKNGNNEPKSVYSYLDYDTFSQHIQMQRAAEDLLAENNEQLQGTPREKKEDTCFYSSALLNIKYFSVRIKTT